MKLKNEINYWSNILWGELNNLLSEEEIIRLHYSLYNKLDAEMDLFRDVLDELDIEFDNTLEE